MNAVSNSFAYVRHLPLELLDLTAYQVFGGMLRTILRGVLARITEPKSDSRLVASLGVAGRLFPAVMMQMDHRAIAGC